jgi:tetratricopeptide (TPR) repeat protein
MGQVLKLAELVLDAQPGHVAAHRIVEHTSRRAGDWTGLARALLAQAQILPDPTAKIGLLWDIASLEEWRLPSGNADTTYARILEIDAADPGALEARLRRELPAARRGETEARQHVIAALRSLISTSASDDSSRLALQLRLALLVENAGPNEGIPPREALSHYRGALTIDGLSVTAATGLARMANRLRDTEGAVAAACALAELASEPVARARYLVEAAELLLSTEADERLGSYFDRRQRACAHLERALEGDPDALAAATLLCAVRGEDNAGERLIDPLRSALRRAKHVDAIVFYGSEIARIARDDLDDLPLGIDALRRVRAVAPDHAPSLLTLSELYIAQRTWPEAVDALESVVSLSKEASPRLTALFALASIYEHVLERPSDAEKALRSALELESGNARALRALIRHVSTHHASTLDALTQEDLTEITHLLAKLSEVEEEPEARCDILLQLADIRLRLGNAAGAEQALIEAVARTPGSDKAFARLASIHRVTGDPLKAEPRAQIAYARALGQVVARGRDLGVSHGPWYATLGTLETEALGRLRDGIAHLQRAVQLEPARGDIRHRLARAFAKSGAHEEAIRTVMAMIVPSPALLLSLQDPRTALADLEASFSAERRGEEALVVSELRALGGDLDDGRLDWLKKRRLRAREQSTGELDRPTLVSHVLPAEGRHVLLEVAAAVAGLETRVLRADVAELGLSSRDRISPRSGNVTRALMDRVLDSLGLADIELVLTPAVARTRVLAQDTLWIVAPKSLADAPEPVQLAALGRALTRISLGAPWLEELPAPHVEAYLVACARQVVPGYGQEDLDVLASKLVAHYEPLVARSIGRKQKKLLEELAVHMEAPDGRLVPMEPFIHALARAEVRAAMLLTGDLLGTLEDLRSLDPALHRVTEVPGPRCLGSFLEHPFGGDVCRFAMTGEAIALRRRIGTTWTS